MPRTLKLIAALMLVVRAGSATIIIAVGTRDGLLVCEDRRLTAMSSTGKVSYSDAAKAQQIGKFGFFAVTGEVSAAVTNVFGQSYTTFDILSDIPSFFASRDIQQFNEQMAVEFEAYLRDRLNKKPVNPSRQSQGPRALTEVLLYWTDQSGRTRFYAVDITGGLLDEKSPTPVAPRLMGQFISLNAFATSKPVVRGKGVLGYNAIVAGTDPSLDDLRRDEELKPFLSDFVDASSVDSIAATRSIKKLIRLISERQDSISPDGLSVGPVSDCFLGTNDGIKNINQ
jgi:hypothetical protein